MFWFTNFLLNPPIEFLIWDIVFSVPELPSALFKRNNFPFSAEIRSLVLSPRAYETFKSPCLFIGAPESFSHCLLLNGLG